MRKEKLCYDQKKNKRESIPAWKNQRKNNFYSRKKKNKFHKHMRNREYHGNNYKIFKPQDSTIKEPTTVLNKYPAQKEILKCWEFGGTCYFNIVQQGKIILMFTISKKQSQFGTWTGACLGSTLHWKISKKTMRLLWLKLKV